MGTTCTSPPSAKPTTVTLLPTLIIGSPPHGSVSSGANASMARHSYPCTNIHPEEFNPTGLLTVPTSPIIPSLPVRAAHPLRPATTQDPEEHTPQ
jgi:hypothetical protein